MFKMYAVQASILNAESNTIRLIPQMRNKSVGTFVLSRVRGLH